MDFDKVCAAKAHGNTSAALGPIKPADRHRLFHTKSALSSRTSRSAQHPRPQDPASEIDMWSPQSACVLLLLLSTLPMFFGHPTIIERAEQRSECEGCGDECNKCKYGSAFSHWCGLKECLKGPGEMCGGVRDKYGLCGEGMYCSQCHKCTGCSIDTLECFSGICPVYEQMHLRHPEHMQGFQLDK